MHKDEPDVLQQATRTYRTLSVLPKSHQTRRRLACRRTLTVSRSSSRKHDSPKTEIGPRHTAGRSTPPRNLPKGAPHTHTDTHTHLHTHTHTHTLTNTHSYTHTHTLSLSLSLSHTHTHSHTHIHTHAHTHTHRNSPACTVLEHSLLCTLDRGLKPEEL